MDRKRTIWKLLLFIVLLATVFTIAGCGGKNGGQQPAKPAESAAGKAGTPGSGGSEKPPAGPAAPAQPAAAGKVLRELIFLYSKIDEQKIVTADINGNNATDVCSNIAATNKIFLSPDYKKASSEGMMIGENQSINIYYFDSSETRPVTVEGLLGGEVSRWSGDSKYLLVLATPKYGSRDYKLFKVEVDTNRREQVKTEGIMGTSASQYLLNPVENSLIYYGKEQGDPAKAPVCHIFCKNLDTGAERSIIKLGDPGGLPQDMMVSPDGSKLLYILNGLHVVDIKSGSAVKMNVNVKATSLRDVAWSWDSSCLAVAGTVMVKPDAFGNQIRVIKDIQVYKVADGSLVNTIPLGSDLYMVPSVSNNQLQWSSDNKHLVMIASSEAEKKKNLYRVPVSGGPVEKIVHVPDGYQIQWVVVKNK
ncbi:MAG: hypothetical protein K6U04_15300 [Armatimonadetes bacterium]|nr:hypothetical protein [Armatimonadota bacterium]